MSTVGNAQRFLPLQHADSGYSAGALIAPSGVGAPGMTSAHTSSNVVQLRPSAPTAAPAIAPAVAAPIEDALGSAAQGAGPAGVGFPTSTAAARERRRQVLITLTGIAFVTLLGALLVGGLMVPLHIAVDVLTLGYVILLVRHRQIAAERSNRIEPIRPPVTEQAPAHVQMAPSYLLRSGT